MNNQDHKDAFEQFLTEETDKHQMFASDAVWANISKQVQTRKSWPALTIVAFLIIVSLSVATFLNYPPDNILAKIHYNDSVQVAHQKQNAAILASKPKDDNFEARISSQKITEKTFAAIEQQQTAPKTPDVVLAAVEEAPKAEPVIEKATKPTTKTDLATTTTALPFTIAEKVPVPASIVTDQTAIAQNDAQKVAAKKDDTDEATDNI